jgi:hypothetical protein
MVLPKEANYATMKVLNDLRMNLSYTEDELKKWDIDINEETNMISWKEDGERDIPIGEKATGIIVDELRMLDSQNKITSHTMPIYEKFIPVTE